MERIWVDPSGAFPKSISRGLADKPGSGLVLGANVPSPSGTSLGAAGGVPDAEQPPSAIQKTKETFVARIRVAPQQVTCQPHPCVITNPWR
jgi:hypothetical protein